MVIGGGGMSALAVPGAFPIDEAVWLRLDEVTCVGDGIADSRQVIPASNCSTTSATPSQWFRMTQPTLLARRASIIGRAPAVSCRRDRALPGAAPSLEEARAPHRTIILRGRGQTRL